MNPTLFEKKKEIQNNNNNLKTQNNEKNYDSSDVFVTALLPENKWTDC